MCAEVLTTQEEDEDVWNGIRGELEIEIDPIDPNLVDMNAGETMDIEYTAAPPLRRSKRLAPIIPNDIIPAPRGPMPEPSNPSPSSPTPDNFSPPPEYTITETDEFGQYEVYIDPPQVDPTLTLGPDFACDAPTFNVAPDSSNDPTIGFGSDAHQDSGKVGPFGNWSIFALMNWWYSSATRSLASLNELVHGVLLDPKFQLAHLLGFSAEVEAKKMDAASNSGPPVDDPGVAADGWRSGNIRLPLPKAGKKQTEAEAPFFEIENVQYRDIVEVTKFAFQDPSVTQLNLKGHGRMFDPGNGRRHERIHGEAYTSDTVLEFEEEIRIRPGASDCKLETVVAIWMLYSDSTHLANFGTAAIWPVYGWLGNLSKYIRGKPSKFAAHHLAYIPKLPDSISDTYKKIYGSSPTPEVLTQLRRDLFQAIWRLLLTPELAEAYCHGIQVLCGDGIIVLIAAIKNLAKHLCPRCNIEKRHVSEMGSKRDMKRREKLERGDNQERISLIQMVRNWVFKKGYSLTHNAVMARLAFGSLTPTVSAFSEFFFPLGVNFYSLLAVDLMHEFELGVWKSLMVHLVRMCIYFGPDVVRQLDQRYRHVPTFGRSTIRRFRNNVSEMKKFAARDFEDLLQCAQPVFENLFPEPFNTLVLDLLGSMATWHAYAKMRLHTDSTLYSFKKATTSLGRVSREFSKQTANLKTRELPKESAARQKRRKKSNRHGTSQSGGELEETRFRFWNLFTYKFHALGDYVRSILRFGTIDSYSSQLGEAEHRRVKQFYQRTNKNRPNFQIARHGRRQRLLKAIETKLGSKRPTPGLKRKTMVVDFAASEPLPWLSANKDDAAVNNLIPKLKNHLLARILGGDEEEDFNDDDRRTIAFVDDRIYKHKSVRFNYTTYDVRRKQHSCNPRTQADLMVLNPSDDKDQYPYWYARLIGIFHIRILHTGSRSKSYGAQTFDVLWVRWFGADDRQKKWGLHANRMPRIGFQHAENEMSFGFLNPNAVLRACHIIPAFAFGYDNNGLPTSIGRPRQEVDDEDEPDTDWAYYYVNMWADRDMTMRFRGGGVGHKATHDATRTFEEQHGTLAGVEDDEMEEDWEDEMSDSDTGNDGSGSDSDDSESDSGDDSDVEISEAQQLAELRAEADGDAEDLEDGVDDDYEGYATP
ncbi:hypothetical protein GGX14DRAFT_674069 [Mycena pura]|uniref:Uncharacterized protein n=1 Tax=Mycena pura TaxID=153505 RepID=A0AAD6UW55_9AGAR|nr:hypothetical protein GGX14DRAFT_674069 [Mycena pura]